MVQPLVGNLVFFSNHGRYEPRLATKWIRTMPNQWAFEIRSGLKCENGELITADSFKESLERSIRFTSKKGQTPVLNKLAGYNEFIKGDAHINGLVADRNQLIFNFNSNISAGLVEVLSLAPFGYISKANLNADYSWKDKTKFVSSGPYRISKIELGKEYVLELRPEWADLVKTKSPRTVVISHKLPIASEKLPLIIDSLYPMENLPTNLSKYNLVPEYLNSVLLGNLSAGYFSKLEVRRVFRHLVEYNRDKLPEKFGPHYRTSSFYPNAKEMNVRLNTQNRILPKPSRPLIIC